MIEDVNQKSFLVSKFNFQDEKKGRKFLALVSKSTKILNKAFINWQRDKLIFSRKERKNEGTVVVERSRVLVTHGGGPRFESCAHRLFLRKSI